MFTVCTQKVTLKHNGGSYLSSLTEGLHFLLLHMQKGKSPPRLPERGIVTDGNENTDAYQNTECQIKAFHTAQKQFIILWTEEKFTRTPPPFW